MFKYRLEYQVNTKLQVLKVLDMDMDRSYDLVMGKLRRFGPALRLKSK